MRITGIQFYLVWEFKFSQGERTRPACGGSLEDKLCPDKIEGWTLQERLPCSQPRALEIIPLKGLTLAAGGDTPWARAGRKRSSSCSLGKCNGSRLRKSQYRLSQVQ
jgi:hypothetical protein